MLLLNPRGRQRRNLRLKNRAHFRQMNGPAGLANLDHQSQRLANCLRGAVGDEGSASGIGLDQSFFPQCLYRFPYRSPTHPEALRQISLSRQLIASLERALQHRFFDLLNDLLVKSRCSNRLVHKAPNPNGAGIPTTAAGTAVSTKNDFSPEILESRQS